MAKCETVYIWHMLDAARQARRIVDGKSRTDFDQDIVMRLALAHLIQIIGEAARRLSPAFRAAHPEIPWHSITGMRHRIVHDYLNVNEDVLWQTVTQEMDPLIAQLTKFPAPPVE